jgi:hypothetical protein
MEFFLTDGHRPGCGVGDPGFVQTVRDGSRAYRFFGWSLDHHATEGGGNVKPEWVSGGLNRSQDKEKILIRDFVFREGER